MEEQETLKLKEEEVLKPPHHIYPSTYQKVPDHLKSQFFRDLWRDINHLGLDCTILIHGRKRTGKSWLALKIMEILDLYRQKDIDYNQVIQERVHFRVSEFAKAIGQSNHPGTVLILDEAGVDASNMEWWKSTIKNLRDIQHVDGIRHLILIIVLPKIEHLAKSSRDMVNVEIKTIFCDKERKLTKCKITHKGFFEESKDRGVYHRTRVGDTIRSTFIGPPSKELTDAYERYSRPYKEKIIKEKVDEIVRLSESKEGKGTKAVEQRNRMSDDEIIKAVLAKPDRYRTLMVSASTNMRKVYRLQLMLIQREFNLSSNEATLIRQRIEAENKEYFYQIVTTKKGIPHVSASS